ncbi:NEDD8-conjugating protein ubc12 [Lodderomyces elongisporus]|uniref:NEDD8-conjugating protein ubc12 n=1 Tax=Lodderomyces elongisporus TaxID=36914 RepID=UPI0029271E07|nr:NEDD8-conjugating protein ubc12 [Lodderomyces elongisporus]WLF78538.1 NEDD8-conjugating protein ubc12 [Lodderomyces elongisporus]
MLKIRELQKKRQEEAAAAAAAGGGGGGGGGGAGIGSTSNSPSPAPSSTNTTSSTKSSAAQLRIQKDLAELDLPKTIKLHFPRPQDVFYSELTITPQSGYYKSGHFHFKIEISGNFPIDPPKIKCVNKIYHPNIDLQGNICLNILREDWSPVLSLNSVLIGLNFLFLEPNPNDPLNKEAANMLVKDKKQFERNVRNSMRGGYVDGEYYDPVV